MPVPGFSLAPHFTALSIVVAMAWSAAAHAAVVRGVVRATGAIPAAVLTKTSKSGQPVEAGCGDPTTVSPRLLVDAEGGVRHAVVWVEEGGTGDSPQRGLSPVPVVDQRGCVFEPHVVALPVGGTVAIRNSDPVIHNIRIFQGAAMVMRTWQKADAADVTWRFTEAGPYVVRCGVHPWMYAWVVVTPGRAAVTDATGRFTLSDVPAGRRSLHVWHEALGAREAAVAVGPDETALEPVVFVVS